MVDSNKISIKINIQNKLDKPNKLLQKKDVIEWNIKRITGALLLFIIILSTIIFSMYKESSLPDNELMESDTFQLIQKNNSQVVPENDLIEPETIQPVIDNKPDNILTQENNSQVAPENEIIEPEAIQSVIDKKPDNISTQENNSQVVPENEIIESDIIQPVIDEKSDDPPEILPSSDKEPLVKKNEVKEKGIETLYPAKADLNNITRASISTGLFEKEPVGIFDSLIMVNKNQAVAVFYFTEIIDMKGSVLYHQWRLNNQIIFNKQINIIGNRWRATTSKLITHNQVGDWTVRLVNQNDIVLNELKFEVNLK